MNDKKVIGLLWLIVRILLLLTKMYLYKAGGSNITGDAAYAYHQKLDALQAEGEQMMKN